MRILGIETSCDESAVCVIDAQGNFGADFRFDVLGNALISQNAIHTQYGGVFPNLAKREHAKNLVPLLEQTLEQAGALQRGDASLHATIAELKKLLVREPELYEQLAIFLQKYAKPEIDAIAVTVGPGLPPALWVGVNFARALSTVWNLPVVAVNHMEGHIVSALIADTADERGLDAEQRRIKSLEQSKRYTLNAIRYPMLSLLISGGHTELVLSTKWHDYKILGATRDDAAGEAFDKVARLLGLPYPGGAELSRLAREARSRNLEATLKLPRPMLHDENLDFSFAGLKTAVLRIVEANSPVTEKMKLNIAREFEDAVTDVLVGKTMKAVDEYGIQTVIVGGGVSANSHIRAQLAEQLTTVDCQLLTPPIELATDNALMIALAGYFHAKSGDYVEARNIKAEGSLRLGK